MKSSSSSSSSQKQSSSKSALNRSAVSLLDESEAAKISAHAASHAKPKCKPSVSVVFAIGPFLFFHCKVFHSSASQSVALLDVT